MSTDALNVYQTAPPRADRFLILQGEIERISTMKPKAENVHEVGMLEWLDNIIGTSRYNDPLLKLSSKVAEFNEERREKLTRISIVEKFIERLEVPMQNAVQYVKSLNDVVLLKNQIYQKHAHELRSKINVEEEKLKDAEKCFGRLQKKFQHFTSAKKQRQSVISNLCNTVKKMNKNKEKLIEELNEAQLEAHFLRETLSQGKIRKKRLKRLLDEEEEKLTQLESVIKENKKEIEKLAKNVERFQARKIEEEAKFEEIMNKMKVGTLDLQEKKRKIQDKLINIKDKSNKCLADYDIACTVLKIYKSKETQASTKLKQILDSYKTTKKELFEYKNKLQDLNNNISNLEQQQQKAQTEYTSNILEREKISTRFRDLLEQFCEAESSVQDYISRKEIADRLMQETSSGHLPGVFGRLEVVCGIDKKYDIPISVPSATCGPSDFTVVDTAQKEIEFLKCNNIRQTTLNALDKHEHLRPYCNQRIKTPENVPRLFDLLNELDDNDTQMLYYTLKGTLFAETLTQATIITYGAVRYKAGTLKGELIQTSGNMTGRSRMGQHATADFIGYIKEKLQQMGKELSDAEMKKNNLERKCTSLEEEIGEITKTLNSIRAEHDCCSFEIMVRETRKNTLKNLLDEQKEISKKSVTDPKERARLTADIEKKKTEYFKAARDVIKLEVDVKALDVKIIETPKGRLNEVEKTLKEVKEKIDKIQFATIKLKVAINSSKKYAARSKEKIKNVKQDIKNAESDLHKIKGEQGNLCIKEKQLLIDIQAVANKITDLEKQLEEEREGMKKLIRKETEIKTAKIEYDIKIRKYCDSVKNLKTNMNEILHHEESLKLEEISDEIDSQELPTLTDEQLMAVDVGKLQENVALIESSFPSTPPDIWVVQEYKERIKSYESLASELKDIAEKRDKMFAIHEEQREKRRTDFLAGFKIINCKLKEIFQMISTGGDAELECTYSDPYDSGVAFSVRFEKKSWKNISKLSGDEKTLSSLALVLALHYYKPTPMCVMDKIDVSTIGDYIKKITRNAQFVISL